MCNGDRKFSFEMKEESEVSCAKFILQSIGTQKGTNIVIYDIFEYGAESGAECTGVKQYFIDYRSGITTAMSFILTYIM